MRRHMAHGPALGLLLLWVLAWAPGRAVASDLVDFARCLRRAGATFYTAAWCPHCRRQTRMFGKGFAYLNVVDCTAGCEGIRSLPTWRFADGSRFSGIASFEFLAARTRCRMGEEGPEEPEEGESLPEAGSYTHERYIGGAKIIEVPRR